MVVRLGSGGFGAGYSASLDSDDGTYGAVKFGGKKVSHGALHCTEFIVNCMICSAQTANRHKLIHNH